jgi:hypothetical protein
MHMNYDDPSVSASMTASFSKKDKNEKHEADRKIDVKLYTLYVEQVETEEANAGLEPEFVAACARLPTRFSEDSHAFLRFLRKWGRYVVNPALHVVV